MQVLSSSGSYPLTVGEIVEHLAQYGLKRFVDGPIEKGYATFAPESSVTCQRDDRGLRFVVGITNYDTLKNDGYLFSAEEYFDLMTRVGNYEQEKWLSRQAEGGRACLDLVKLLKYRQATASPNGGKMVVCLQACEDQRVIDLASVKQEFISSGWYQWTVADIGHVEGMVKMNRSEAFAQGVDITIRYYGRDYSIHAQIDGPLTPGAFTCDQFAEMVYDLFGRGEAARALKARKEALLKRLRDYIDADISVRREANDQTER